MRRRRRAAGLQGADQLAVGIDHQHLVDAELLHHGYGIDGQALGRNAARLRMHDVADRHFREILHALEHAAQVAIRKHAHGTVVRVDDGRHAWNSSARARRT